MAVALAVLVVGLAACAVVFRVAMRALDTLTERWRIEQDIDRTYWTVLNDIKQRRVDIEERRLAIEEKAKAPPPRPEPMPSDLRSRIAAFDEDWAQEEETRRLSSLYAEFGTWEDVRKNLAPLAPVVETTDHIFTPSPEFVR